MKDIDDIIEKDVVVNSEAFNKREELTAKLTVRGHLLAEAIYDVTLLSDRKFLAAYLKGIIRDYHCGTLELEDGAGI